MRGPASLRMVRFLNLVADTAGRASGRAPVRGNLSVRKRSPGERQGFGRVQRESKCNLKDGIPTFVADPRLLPAVGRRT